ncbi:hypothetical protein GCM10011609_29300 [Lentzea pudingi]|uniref:Uncharacterized protein n=1 Tax=Lentzea pudingi TaxID=1789439 RepID=A0ABQ2HSK7_9PSEU|nr:hypothetical protein GCM10011609_29300 [Lentzea pudingi]
MATQAVCAPVRAENYVRTGQAACLLVEDSTETVPSEHRKAFGPVRSKVLVPGSQGCCGGE